MVDGLSRSSTCPTLRELYLFSVGRLSDALLESTADHIGLCSTCLQLMRRLEDPDTGVAMLLDETESNLDEELQAILAALKTDRDDIQLSSASCAIPTPDFHLKQGAPRLTEIGQYELGALLGEGAMGSVYRGWHRHLKKHVVVKLLSPNRRMEETSIARFMREMEAVGRLGDHPHIVRAVDAGTDKGNYFIVMDFVDGCDLRQVLKKHGRIPFRNVAEIGRQLALALSHIREHRMVHRDIKPSNVYLTRSGTIKLMDLGLALFQRREPHSESQRHVVGTADYIAPEQWSIETSVDGRADVYALGCTLFELLIGKPPFESYRGFSKKKQAHLQVSPPSVTELDSSIPQALSDVIGRMLAKKPDDRFEQPTLLAAALAEWTQDANLAALSSEALEVVRDTQAKAADPTEVYFDSLLGSQRTWDRRRIVSFAMGSAVGAMGLTAIGLYLRSVVSGKAGAAVPPNAFRTAFSSGEPSGHNFTFNPTKQELVASAKEGTLGLAWYAFPDSNNLGIKVRVKQADLQGEFGLFWGGNTSQFLGRVGTTQHCLFLDASSKSGVALLRHREFGIARPGEGVEQVIEAGTSPIVTISFPSDHLVEIIVHIKDGRISEVKCNEVLLPEIVSGASTSHAAAIGACGVFVRNGSATFTGFELMQQPSKSQDAPPSEALP